MYQPWIFAGVTAAGAGLVALTLTLQRPPEPVMPLPETPGEAVHLVPPTPATVTETPAADEVLQLEPVVIHPARHAPAAKPPEPQLAERPCSEWRELGPTHVVSGTPSGDLSVRALCP